MNKRLAAIEMMIEKTPNDPFPRYARALELRSMGDKAAALAALSELTERSGEYVPSYLMAAQLAAELGKTDDASRFAGLGLERAQRAGDGHAASELQAFLSTLEPGNSPHEE